MSAGSFFRRSFLQLIIIIIVVYAAVDEDDPGFRLCVTLSRGMVDLSGRNLTQVPPGIPPSTQYLDISHNPVGELRGGEFAGLSRLCYLKATHCHLRDMSPHVFSQTPALKVLNMSFNDLSFIPELPLPQLRVLDLNNNLYPSYQIPASFQGLTGLDVLSLGSPAAASVHHSDFDSLVNVTLGHLVLGAGTRWQGYDPGSLAKIKSLQKFSLNVSFCENWSMFEKLLRDLNETQAKSLRFISVFPDSCYASGRLFDGLRTMPRVQNLTIENTWINSSFLELFLENVWLSLLYDLSFVNITYNEDTPDGFQFPTINHTINLCSVTFDGVNHHQYKYPTINMSFEAVSRLNFLKFSGTGMNILPCRVISALPSLETLDLSDNLLTESGFWWCQSSLTPAFPKLRRLSLSKNRFSSLSDIATKMRQMETVESLDLSSNSISLDGACPWPGRLTELSLANNNLGNSIFKFLSAYFTSLDLSKTGITAITRADLSGFTKLTRLKLSSNSIQVLPSDLSVPALVSLYVDQNAITSITREALAGLPGLQSLNAGSNPFLCSCDSHWFVSVFNKSLLVDWPLDYACSTPPALAGRPLAEYKSSDLWCESWLQAAVALPAVLLISAAAALVFYRCDGLWYTKMLWVWIRMRRRGKKRRSMLKDAAFCYHAFISYSHQDSGWVDDRLVPSLEGAGFSLCVHERDFVPGEWIIDNIIKCVESSYKTLFLLSRHFVQSKWCNYELFFAQNRSISIQEDSLVFILLEPIPSDSFPRRFLKLRSLLRQQTYLEWPQDERKQQLFWASLKSMLHMADKAVVLKSVAEAISDALPLLSSDTELLTADTLAGPDQLQNTRNARMFGGRLPSPLQGGSF